MKDNITLVLPCCAHMARSLRAKMVNVRHFPDGETKLSVPANIKGRKVVLVGNTGPSADSFMELLLTCSTLRELGAKPDIIIPYFAYARQDVPKKLEASAAKAVCEAIKRAKPGRVSVINPHSRKIMRWVGGTVIDVMPQLLSALPRMKDVCIIAPDEGARAMARNAAALLKTDYLVLSKQRVSEQKVRTKPLHQDLNARTAVIVDDIISTGGTLEAATRAALRAGASAVYAVVVHNATDKSLRAFMKNSRIRQLVVSNTLPCSAAARTTCVPVRLG